MPQMMPQTYLRHGLFETSHFGPDLPDFPSLDEVAIATKECAKKFNKLRELNTSEIRAAYYEVMMKSTM